MGVSHHHRQHTAAALAFLLFASVITLSRFGKYFNSPLVYFVNRNKNAWTNNITIYLVLIQCGFVFLCAGSGFQEREGSKKRSGSGVLDRFIAQKRLSGPGSSPPSCRSKCGNCSPCKPVHVPIQPGFSMPLEYYPEAWRCKCGNKLFMP